MNPCLALTMHVVRVGSLRDPRHRLLRRKEDEVGYFRRKEDEVGYFRKEDEVLATSAVRKMRIGYFRHKEDEVSPTCI
ncbi:hypothetical protein Nepgr_008296 [Nepenthes gracilis]|uniref:Uncharacterized protein n=1 Tax=Nepenthes gracilis TaxID=150966 RepID=A0AAD3S9H2_NEPGR|nr:hypothetical protein Nepgr_008296 [Nepenthes gracilis]